jgi:hypothetical protein
MGEVSTIGLDIAKSVFQIHGVDFDGAVVMRKRIIRAKLLEFFAALPACLVGIEACPTAHHWMPPTSGAWAHGEAAAAELRKSLCEAQQKRCQRRCRYLRGGHAAVDAVCGDEVRTTAVGLDAASQPATSGLSANDAVECDPRAPSRSSALSRRRAAMARQSCSRSSLTSRMVAFQRRLGSASASLLANKRPSGHVAIEKRIHAWHRSLKQLRDAEIGLAAHSAASFDNIISVSSRSRASPAAADRV